MRAVAKDLASCISKRWRVEYLWLLGKADASREAVLDGRLGGLADSGNPQEIWVAIKQALARPRVVQKELEYFSFERFVERWHALLRRSNVIAGFSPRPT